MMFWKPLRVAVLMLTFGGTLWLLAKAVLSSPQPKQQTQVIFPDQVALSGWQQLSSTPVSDPIGRIYHYRQADTQIMIEMRYMPDRLSNEKPFRQYDPTLAPPTPPGQTPPIMRQLDQIGYHSLSVQNGKAYLRSCMNPRGQAAVTYGQFIHNRYTDDLQLSRLLPWLAGQAPLRDYRCLWTYLSTPLQDPSPEAAYQVLQQSWTHWYRAWHPKFPNP